MTEFIPNAALDHFDLGARAYVASQNQEALECFERAIAAHEPYDDAHYLRGLTLLRLGRDADAVAALQRAAEVTQNIMLRGYARTKVAAVADGPGVKHSEVS